MLNCALRQKKIRKAQQNERCVAMNLAILEKMIAQSDLSVDALRYLIGCRSECEWLDYKKELHLGSHAERCDFTRDVVAMKNVGGGYLLVGVEDKTWRPVGLSAPLPYDTKQVRDIIRQCSGLELDVDLVHHNAFSEVGTGLFALVHVRGPQRRKKRRAPTVIAKDFDPKMPWGLRRGEIHIRRGDSTARIQSQAELEDILEQLEGNTDQSAMEASDALVPFAVFDGTYRLLEKGYESFVGRIELRERVVSSLLQDPRLWIIDVHGPGGVGKSALVNWAVYEFYRKRTFEAILHLSAKETVLTAEGIRPSARSLYSLENLLDHIADLFQEVPPEELNDKRQLAIELLDAWQTLLVLDNMETVSDGRILKFVQELPHTTKAKVLLTSRHKTGGWELPVPVRELTKPEVKEFLETKVKELDTLIPTDDVMVERVAGVTGGLPLAIQWLIARIKKTHNITRVLETVGDRDSPILEFSFRNIWNLLPGDAKECLAILTIFDAPPDIQQLAVATEWGTDRVDQALSDLSEVTLVSPNNCQTAKPCLLASQSLCRLPGINLERWAN